MTAKPRAKDGASDAADRDAWARFDAEMKTRIEAADRGELYDADEVFAELKAKIRAMAARKRG